MPVQVQVCGAQLTMVLHGAMFWRELQKTLKLEQMAPSMFPTIPAAPECIVLPTALPGRLAA